MSLFNPTVAHVCPYLELHLHAGDILSRLNMCQPLNVGVQVSGGDLSVPACHSLQQSIMDEDVLVFCLDHVVPLRAHQCDMAVNVDGLLMLDALCHAVDDNEAAGSAHTSAEAKRIKQINKDING